MPTARGIFFHFLVLGFLFSFILQVLSDDFQKPRFGPTLQNKNQKNADVMDFRTTMTTKRQQYLDKTIFIKKAMHCGNAVLLITRPAQFGKTFALTTLEYFYSDQIKDSDAIFAGLSIMKPERDLERFRNSHMNKYTVLKIDFSDVKNDTFKESFSFIQQKISQLFSAHKYLLNGTLPDETKQKFDTFVKKTASKEDTAGAVKYLCDVIHSYYNQTKRVVVLIDGYDTPILTAVLKDFYRVMLEFIKSFLAQTLKDNPNLQKAVITGVIPVADGVLPDGILVETIFDEKFSKFFGFTYKDVRELIRRTTKTDDTKKEITELYDGYVFGGTTIFNPGAVMRYLFDGKKVGWLRTTSRAVLESMLLGYGLYPVLTIQQLLAGEKVTKEVSRYLNFPEIKLYEKAYWTFMLHSGYLAVANTTRLYNLNLGLQIPTAEIRAEILAVHKKPSISYSIKIPKYKDFIDNLVEGNFTVAQATMGNYLQDAGAYFKKLGQDITVDQFSKYVIQMLRGVELRYNTSMLVNVQENWQQISIKVKPKTDEYVPVYVVIRKTGMTSLAWSQLKRILCPFARKLDKRKTEIVIQYSKWCIGSCLRTYVELKSGRIY